MSHRVRAARPLLRGEAPAQVALKVGAPRQTVYRWLDVLKADGIDALRVTNKGERRIPTARRPGADRIEWFSHRLPAELIQKRRHACLASRAASNQGSPLAERDPRPAANSPGLYVFFNYLLRFLDPGHAVALRRYFSITRHYLAAAWALCGRAGHELHAIGATLVPFGLVLVFQRAAHGGIRRRTRTA